MPENTIVLLAIYFLILLLGAQAAVRLCMQWAGAGNISALFFGTILLSLATTAPELAISINLTRIGWTDAVMGVVIGSSLVNMLLILGVTALRSPISIPNRSIAFDGLFLVFALCLVTFVALSGFEQITSSTGDSSSAKIFQGGESGVVEGVHDGYLFLALLLVYLIYVVARESRQSSALAEGSAAEAGSGLPIWSQALVFVAGIAALAFGSFSFVNVLQDVLLDSSDLWPEYLLQDPRIIMLIPVALGVALPEIIVTIFGLLRGQRQLVVGNLIGSSVFNFVGVVGATAVIASGMGIGLVIDYFYVPDIAFLLIIAILVIPFMLSGRMISRMEGLVLAVLWCAYAFLNLYNGSVPGLTEDGELLSGPVFEFRNNAIDWAEGFAGGDPTFGEGG